MKYASSIAPQLGISRTALAHAHDLVCSFVGLPWLKEQERRSGFGGRTIADAHPLFRALVGRARFCVIEVCELAGYLLTFRNQAALKDIAASLRDADKYGATILELQVAYKFQAAGADINLNPITSHGIADCAVTLDGKTHIVEVSGFPKDPFRSDLMAFTGAMQIAHKAGIRKSGVRGHLAVEVTVLDSGTGKCDLRRLRKEAHTAVVESVGNFAERRIRIRNRYGFGTVAVRLAQPLENPDTDHWSMVSCLARIPRSKLSQAGNIDYKSGHDTHWAYIRVPNDAVDPYDRIRRKLKIESRQLRGCSDGVIVLDVSGLGLGVLGESDAAARALIENFRREHKSTTGIALITRVQQQNGTMGIAGPYFALGPTAMSSGFWNRVLALDSEGALWSALQRLK